MGKKTKSSGHKQPHAASHPLTALIAEEVQGHDHHAASQPLDAFPATEPVTDQAPDEDYEIAETRMMKNPLAAPVDAHAPPPDARRMQTLPVGVTAALVVEGSGTRYRITKSLTIIGRVREVADMVVSDDKASRHHAAITFESGRFFVEDLDSTNGTYVNGVRVKRIELSANAEIRIGRCKMRLEMAK